MDRQPMKTVLSLVVVLLLTAVASAQQLPKFDRPMPSNAEILKMGYVKFGDWADKHGKDMNEVASDNLARWYADLREKANQKALQGKPYMASMEAATQAMTKWAAAYWFVFGMQKGGGTMYTHAGEREVALIADTEAAAIASWSGPAGKVTVIKPFQATEAKPRSYNSTSPAEYAQALKDEAKTLAALQAALKKLSPGAQAAFNKRMRDLTTVSFR